MARRPDPFDKSSMAASFGVHGGIVLVFWLSGLVRSEPIEFITYEITLVSPPATVQAEVVQPATEQMVVERPEPTPPAPEPESEAEVVPLVQDDDPPPKPPELESTPAEELALEEETTAASTEDPPEDAAESGEDINVRMEGLRRDYPAYYNGIIRQIDNCFRPPRDGRDWATTVFFNIEMDGSVAGVEFVARSGNFDFDFSAMGAIECAGNGRFGPLPADFQWDRLPVQFDFTPRGELLEVFPSASRPSEVTNL
jgi:outer membrane biosynthesis protein TonB